MQSITPTSAMFLYIDRRRNINRRRRTMFYRDDLHANELLLNRKPRSSSKPTHIVFDQVVNLSMFVNTKQNVMILTDDPEVYKQYPTAVPCGNDPVHELDILIVHGKVKSQSIDVRQSTEESIVLHIGRTLHPSKNDSRRIEKYFQCKSYMYTNSKNACEILTHLQRECTARTMCHFINGIDLEQFKPTEHVPILYDCDTKIPSDKFIIFIGPRPAWNINTFLFVEKWM